jgi:hypothetical protein
MEGRSRTEPISGEGGIRTPDAGITDITVFETAAFNHSATSPRKSVPSTPRPLQPFLQDAFMIPNSGLRLKLSAANGYNGIKLELNLCCK